MTAPKKRSVRSSKKTNQSILPGSIYFNNNRYWWKVHLPGGPSIKARPLKPIGAMYAITDHSTVMVELQLFTGMRPGEVVILRPCDINRVRLQKKWDKKTVYLG